MILRPEQIALIALGLPATPANKGGSSSQANNATYNTDKRLVVDSGVGVSADSSTVSVAVNTLDGGAIAKSFDFATANNAGLMDLGKEIFTKSFDALNKDRAFLQQSSDVVAKAYDNAKGEGTQKFLISVGVLATVGIVAAVAFSGGRK